MKHLCRLCFVLVGFSLLGCVSTTPDVTGTGQQLAVRQVQTREYDTLDKAMTLRAVVSTLQDLGFIIDTADADIATVTATRLYQHAKYETYSMRMTVTVRQREANRIAVRVNARLQDKAIDNPETFRDFFAALDKAMFLVLQKID
jgi:uncharacterized protein YchJ